MKNHEDSAWLLCVALAALLFWSVLLLVVRW